MNLEFFEELYADPGFCEELGRTMLAVGQLESCLRAYLEVNGEDVRERRATLGVLTPKLVELGFLSANGQGILEVLGTQRNYFAHKLFDLFSDRIDETILPRSNLVDGDVSTFTDYAWTLAENLRGIASIVQSRLAAVGDEATDAGAKKPLF